jgi:hypothetical protein
MIDKVKNFFAAMASLTVLLYATGYIADYSHATMLGISMVEPTKVYYLVSGGTFFLSTLYAIYATLVSHPLYFLLFFVIIAAIILYEAYARKENITHIPKPYAVASFLTFIFMFVTIHIFTSPFVFSDFLLQNAKPGLNDKHSSFIAKELRTWILNGGDVNKQKLTVFYVLLILSTVISAVMLYSMIRQWKRRQTGQNTQSTETTQSTKAAESQPPPSDNSSKQPNRLARLLEYLNDLPRLSFGVLIILMIVIVVVQIVTIPINYGILIKTNDYPEVEVEVETANLLEDHDHTKPSKVWILKEGTDDLLLYAVYLKDSDNLVFRLFTLKKKSVKKIEIIDNSFVFKYK